MTYRFIALLIALALVWWVPRVRTWHDLRWFAFWQEQCRRVHGVARVILVLAPPAVVTAVIAGVLAGAERTGILWLAFAVLVLLFSLGPRHLESDVDAVLDASGLAAQEQAAQVLRPHADDDTALALEASALVEATAMSALIRRFGIIFWFVVLGPAVALLYRLAQVQVADATADADSHRLARRFAAAMDWPAAHLMVFAMALVSRFDAVIGAWRAWHGSPSRSHQEPDTGFLGPAACAGAGLSPGMADADEPGQIAAAPALAAVRRLLLRTLWVWLAVLALLVVADGIT